LGIESADCISVTTVDIYSNLLAMKSYSVWSGAKGNSCCMERVLCVLMLTELRGIFSGVAGFIDVRDEQ
jgi:hypothetical protein